MIRFLLRFLREKEKIQVFEKDSRAEARCESFQEKGKIGAKVIQTAKKPAKWIEKLLKKAFFRQHFTQERSLKVVKPREIDIRPKLCQM
jgi:hypothetical protein